MSRMLIRVQFLNVKSYAAQCASPTETTDRLCTQKSDRLYQCIRKLDNSSMIDTAQWARSGSLYWMRILRYTMYNVTNGFTYNLCALYLQVCQRNQWHLKGEAPQTEWNCPTGSNLLQKRMRIGSFATWRVLTLLGMDTIYNYREQRWKQKCISFIVKLPLG